MEICVTFAIFYIGMFYVHGMTLYYLCKKYDNGVEVNIKPVYFVWLCMNSLLILLLCIKCYKKVILAEWENIN